ncbi:MAG: Na+/H+ antiporter subunit E [Thermincolia bacterium]
MAFQILLNLIIAFSWVLIGGSWSPVSFGVGYFIGLVLLLIFRGFLTEDFYMKRVWAAIVLFLIFNRELVMSNIAVIKLVLSPKLNIRPGILAVPVKVKGPWEITLFANLITLTPGTLSVDLSPDNKVLYVHAIDIPDAEEMINSFKDTFEKRIMEVFK